MLTGSRRRRRACWAGVLFAVCLAGGGAAAAAVPQPSGPVGHISDLSTEPGKAYLTFSVTGLPSGASVDPGSLAVTVDGSPLQASATAGTVSGSRTPVLREAVLTLDTSGSMAGAGITAARAAAIAYARQVPADVRLGLITFANRPVTLLQPTTNRNALIAALSKVHAAGNTALYDGVAAGVDELAGLPSSAQRRLLVLSDGADTSSFTSLPDLLQSLHNSHVPADVVAFRLPGNRGVLNEIAAASRGVVLPAADAGSLGQAFSTAAKAFGQRLGVTITVPPRLDHRSVTLTVTARAGGQTITALVRTTLIAAFGSDSAGGASTTSTLDRIRDPHFIAVLALAFIAMLAVALLLLLGPVIRNDRLAWQTRVAEAGRYRVRRSMGQQADGSTWQEPETPGAVAQRALSLVGLAVQARGQRDKLTAELERAGLRMRAEEWAVLQLSAILAVAAIAYTVSRSIVGVIVGAILGWLLCRVFIRVKISNRAKAFENQLPDNLQLLAGSLRSGFSLAQALATVVREGTEPTASELTRALTEVRLGANLEDALDRVAERMQCEDLHWVVMAIRIAREVGGNLAEVLDKTVETMRERARIRGQIRVLSAEGRLSARILTSLPIFVGLIFVLVRPTYVKTLFHSTSGWIIFSVGVIELMLGALWLNRLTKIEV
jgi:tight adherence protein B